MNNTRGQLSASIFTTLREAPISVWILISGTLINKLGTFLQIFLVLYLTGKGFTSGQAGFALGVYGIGAIIGTIAGGSMTDRLGYRMMIAGSMIAAGLLTGLVLYVSSFPVILAMVAVIGATAYAYRPAASALLVALTPQSRHVMVFAAYRLAFNLGMTAGPLLGALLVYHSYALLFWIDGLTSLIFGLLAFFALPTDPAVVRDKQGALPRSSYLQVLADRRYVAFLIALFLNAVVYIQYLAVLPLHVVAMRLPLATYSALVSLNALMVIICEVPVTHIVQRFSARLAIALGIGLVGAGLNLYILPVGVAVLVIGTIVWSLGECIGTPTSSAYPARVAPATLRGRYLAASATSQSLGYALGPMLGTFAWMQFGINMWWGCGLITVLAMLATIAGVKRDPVQEERAHV